MSKSLYLFRLEFSHIMGVCQSYQIEVGWPLGVGEKLEDAPRSFQKGPRFYAYYKKSEMNKFLRLAGFEVLEIRDYPEEIFGGEIRHVYAQKSN